MTGLSRTSEPALNPVLAAQLRQRHPRWQVTAEQTGVLDGAANRRLRPDIVIRHSQGLPVVVETEFSPAGTVEQDARERLGKKIDGQPVEGVLAVRIPGELAHRDQDELDAAIGQARFEYCLFSAGNEEAPQRWPGRGWLAGNVDQLALAIEHAALSETRIAEAADLLQAGISGQTAFLRAHLAARPNMFTRMATILHQEDGEQTTRMAVAIIANAFVFQAAIAGKHGIISPEEFCAEAGEVSKLDVMDHWRAILEVNYLPIFELAKDLLGTIPSAVAGGFLRNMITLADRLAGLGATSMHDLSGQMFQRLIADRKFLATFYTLPASASLLAGMAVSRLQVNWRQDKEIGAIRIADLACGTGSLLGAAQHAVAVRIRQGGGDDQQWHSHMMEQMLIAADIMPAATHLTASTLSSAQPGSIFGDTRVFTMAYGAENDEIRIGSLELIAGEQVASLFGTGATQRADGRGTVVGQEAVVEHESCDLVIMNPPFTNPTNHELADVPVPSFAGFGTSEAEQAAMSRRLKSIRQRLIVEHRRRERNGAMPSSYPAGHGNAGLGSNFIDLAHAKLRPGGCMALVLSSSFVQGGAWSQARQLMEEQYRDVTIVGLAADGQTERAFSADTGMAEMLLIATRLPPGQPAGEGQAMVANLRRRPETRLEAALVTQSLETARRGGQGSGDLLLGDDDVRPAGSFLNAPFRAAMSAFGLRQLNLADIMARLETGRLNLPRMADDIAIATTRLGGLGMRGAGHRDINGAGGRGPFDIVQLEDDEFPVYPALWSHDATRERQLEVAPESKGVPRPDCLERAIGLWERTASRLHFNNDFQINSQPLAACLTSDRSIGGRAWPNFLAERTEWELPLLLWANTTLGLMSFWWLGTRQHRGRSTVTISRLPDLLTIDVRSLTEDQLAQAEKLFKAFRQCSFLPANEAYRDETRQALDQAVLVDLLGLEATVIGGLNILREQWCREPTVHGGKSTRPGAAI